MVFLLVVLNLEFVGVVMILWVALVHMDKCEKKVYSFVFFGAVKNLASYFHSCRLASCFVETKMIPFEQWLVNL